MNVTSAVRDSSVTLPIMPKAPASVNVAALMRLRQNSRRPREGGDQWRTPKRHWIPLSYQNERE